MKLHEMDFRHWEDDHTALLRKERGPGSGHKEEDARWADDPRWYCQQHFHKDRDGGGPYFLNRRCNALLKQDGPFSGHYKDADSLDATAYGQDVYLFCPGPSLADVPIEAFDQQTTLAVNSAGFRVRSTYWVMAESAYALWLMGEVQKYPLKRQIISTARVAVVLRAKERTARQQLFRRVFVARWEEEFVVPARVPAVSVFNALVAAWQFGAKRCIVFGLDLSRPGGQAYVSDVQYTKEGATNPFDDQVRALRQFSLPGMEVVNCSPHSRELLPNFTAADWQEVLP